MKPEAITEILRVEINPAKRMGPTDAWRITYKTSHGRTLEVDDVMSMCEPSRRTMERDAQRFPGLWFGTAARVIAK